jgi:hypothetical protein
VTAHKAETVEVPAGKFAAVRLEETYTPAVVEGKAVVWLAPGWGWSRPPSGGRTGS